MAQSTAFQIQEPQQGLDKFWEDFVTRRPGYVRNILSQNEPISYQNPAIEEGRGPLIPDTRQSQPVTYSRARDACVQRVKQIVRECRRTNEQWTDPDFNMARDFNRRTPDRFCVDGLNIPSAWTPPAAGDTSGHPNNEPSSVGIVTEDLSAGDEKWKDGVRGRVAVVPGSARRVGDIFDRPIFAPIASRSCLWIFGTLLRFKWLPLEISLVWLAFQLSSINRWLFLIFCLCMLGIATLIVWCTSARPALRFSASDVMQSSCLGNCWWVSAVAALYSRNDILQKICVAWDQDCGVYGFLFFRDGDWTYSVVDDYLFISEQDFGDTTAGKTDPFGKKSQTYRERFMTGSRALHFAKCRDQNEFWLPLLEKAYAKAHGDYASLNHGWPSEGVEDITGGVSTVSRLDSVLEKEELWRTLRQANGDLIFSFTTSLKYNEHPQYGITMNHAFSLMKAVEYWDIWKLKKVKLLQIRNPWGEKPADGGGHWRGAWSNGSSEWTPLSMMRLGRRFQDDGTWYMTFEDMLSNFEGLERTRLFPEEEWTDRQAWVKMDVSWISQYNNVRFWFQISKAAEVVLVLSQLDNRYFKGLQGRYAYHLEFLLRRSGDGGNFIARCTAPDNVAEGPQRSVSMEQFLSPGDYEVLVKITAVTRSVNGHVGAWSTEDMVRKSTNRPLKLQQLARNYDVAHDKLQVIGQQVHHREAPLGESEPALVTREVQLPDMAAWNAVCGVGLRILSKDKDIVLETYCHDPMQDEGFDQGQSQPGTPETEYRNIGMIWSFFLALARLICMVAARAVLIPVHYLTNIATLLLLRNYHIAHVCGHFVVLLTAITNRIEEILTNLTTPPDVPVTDPREVLLPVEDPTQAQEPDKAPVIRQITALKSHLS